MYRALRFSPVVLFADAAEWRRHLEDGAGRRVLNSARPRQRLRLDGVEAPGRSQIFIANVQPNDATEHHVAAGVAGLLRLYFVDLQKPAYEIGRRSGNARRFHVDRRSFVELGEQ